MTENTLTGKKALVTGGASGIGAAAVHALAARGAHVVVADVAADAAESVARQVGGEAWAVDLLDTATLAQLSLDVDILVNYLKANPTLDAQNEGRIIIVNEPKK